MKTQFEIFLNEFFETLEEELRFLKAKEIQEVLKHYRDKINSEIDYGTPENKIIQSLPLPKDIANDIYKSRGISFLEIQKKRYRQKEIAKAIISGFIIALILVLFVSVFSFFGYTAVGFNKILLEISTFKSSLDQALILMTIVMLDVALIAILVFVIDLFYIIISNFLVNILKSIKKTYRVHYKFQDFTISGALKNVCKKKNVVAITLASSATIALILFGSSLFAKGYVYRSFNDLPLNAITQDYDNNIKNVNIKGTNANIRFEVDETLEKVKVTYNYEFNKNIDINFNDATLTIKNIGSKTYGLFGLLDEPTPIVVVSFPTIEHLRQIIVELDEGSLYLKEIENISLKAYVDIYNSEVYVENSNINELIIKSYKTNTKIANLDEEKDYFRINNLNIEVSSGSIAMEGISLNTLDIANLNAKTVISNCKANTFNFDTDNGDTVFYEVSGNTLNFVTESANNILDDMTFDNATVTANFASSVTITRFIVKEKLNLLTYNSSSITISRLKAKHTILGNDKNPSMGNIILNYVNRVDAFTDKDSKELVASKTKYNEYEMVNTKITGKSQGALYINRSSLEDIDITQTSTALQVSDSNISGYAKFYVDTAKNLTFTDVTGLNIHFVLKHTKLVYYNTDNNISNTKCYVKFEGASYGLDTNINPEVE